MFQKKVVERIKNTHFKFINILFNISHNVKNTLEADRLQMAIWCLHFPCWISKTTDSHSEYVILVSFLW
jgi:hypothetical protein